MGLSEQTAWDRLARFPGLCRGCRYPFLNHTKRGTTYLRCTRAAWDNRLPRYPQIPVLDCIGFEATDEDGVSEPTRKETN